MRKLVVACVVLLGAIGLTSCGSSSPAAEALALCKQSVKDQIAERDFDFGELKAVNMSEALFGAKITDELDTSKSMYTVSGEVLSSGDGTTKRHTVICMANEEGGAVTMKSPAIVTD